MNFTPDFAVFIVLVVWLIILTFLFLRFYLYYTKLVKNGKKESLIQMMDDVMKREDQNAQAIEKLGSEYVKLKKDSLSHIQKIGLVRFNPFKDTGGDQSFILALVDSENTGVVISSLHTRTGTRWYAKAVVAGKGVEYDLSADEEKALKGARFLSN